MIETKYTYLPWVRQGLISAAIANPPSGSPRIEVTVQANISTGSANVSVTPVSILLFGAADVNGIEYRQIIRTEPPHLTSDFEPNYFTLIEFYQPDFPWMFTPAVAGSGLSQLKPWICLIVVKKRDGIDLSHTEERPLPVLSIKGNAYKELPDLSEAWAWAHTQVGAVNDDAALRSALETRPEHTLSRLMCPRHLEPKTAYFACVVPTYLGGKQAGLGEPVDDATALNDAWTLSANPADIRLPVYHHWEFATGAEGDFESLVWQLQRRQLTRADVGTRKLDISSAGYGLPASDPVDLEGALRPRAAPDDEATVCPSTAFKQRLQALLNETAIPPLPILPAPLYGRWHAAQRSIPDTISPSFTRDYAWLRDINLDPRYRVAAGLGAQIVRDQQEQLMASAWDQVGDIELANQLIRQAQLARAASTAIHEERLGELDPTSFLLMTAPGHTRLRYSGTQTARGHVETRALPLAVTSARFRHVVRLRGSTARRFGLSNFSQRNDLISNLNQGLISAAPKRWPKPNGMMTMGNLPIELRPCNISPESLAQALIEQWPPEHLIAIIEKVQESFAALSENVQQRLIQIFEHLSLASKRYLQVFVAQVRAIGGIKLEFVFSMYKPALALIAEARWLFMRLAGAPDVTNTIDEAMNYFPDQDELRIILFGLAVLSHQQSVEPCDDQPLTRKPMLDINDLKTQLYEELDPRKTIATRVGTLIEVEGWTPNELDLVLVAPDFPAPMYKELAKLSQEWILPGLQHVPQNTLALLESNKCFIEAFMVGLNHEMSRELLWRGYPCDQRGTYFRQFWDPRGRFPPATTEAERREYVEAGKDMPPIHEWGNMQIGANFGRARASTGATQAALAQTILLIRGDLLKRYPRATIFMVKARQNGTVRSPIDVTDLNEQDKTQVLYPIFFGELSPDITFLGFSLTVQEAVGNDSSDSGWFLVIQQQPTEPRYGLDETVANSDATKWTWRDLSWQQVKFRKGTNYVDVPPGSDFATVAPDSDYASVAAAAEPVFPTLAKKGPDGEGWQWSDSDSAQIACITLQGPVRVAIHASDLL